MITKKQNIKTTHEFPLNNEQINVGMLSDNTWRGFCTAKEMIFLKKKEISGMEEIVAICP